MVTELDAHTFSRFVREHGVAFIHFWAVWNGYDRTMKAVIRRVEPDYRGRVAVGAIDVDPESHHAICVEHGVMGPPFYACYYNGRLQRTEVGVLTEEELRGRLDGLLRATDPG